MSQKARSLDKIAPLLICHEHLHLRSWLQKSTCCSKFKVIQGQWFCLSRPSVNTKVRSYQLISSIS